MAPASSLPLILSGIVPLALALLYLLSRRHQPKSTITFPPGPKSPDFPALDAWVKCQEWGREYGDLVYIREKNTLITNSSRTAVDLLEKRARIYSSRETSWTAILCGGERVLSLQEHSAKWRTKKKLYNQIFRQSAISRFYPAQYKKVLDLTRSLVATPEQIMQHTLIFSQSVIYASLYGLDIGYDDPLSRKGKETVDIFARMLSSGFPTLERFPWLRFMPSFFPGCGFKQTVLELRENYSALDTIPFDRAVNNFKLGTGTSVVAELAFENEGKPADIEMIKGMGSTSFIAASDTTMSSVTSFLLTMTLHPDVQAKGRAEIDRVIGRTRLPTFEDRKSLPYVESIYREIMRLHPPLPLGVNHVSTEDDYYNGYHIPKGCVIIPNIWAMNRDPNVYSEPNKFIPERFLDSQSGPFTSINDIYAYGFGRRVCVGRYMADNTVWLAIAYILATLDLRKAKDNEGNEINIPGDFTKTFFRHPMPYISSILPRDPQARDLISATTELT
ncbi:cytochrome P450 2 Le.CYP2 [Rhodocollybia butyracea]|uniref:Cytochrome P450 2 Le.CYP2 n=1 Tax=Rhodocollybia butyracea TaxID=206335 RepID=A0A9P5Q8F8_9AGAR|nr:cytochrome P450 2 Le.CYP2 [Rhodocollybia butyracea]